MPSLILPAVLPFALLASSGAASSDNAPINLSARTQGRATARIVRGESIRFGNFSQRLASPRDAKKGAPYDLPLARSHDRREKPSQPTLILVEFH